MQGILKIVLALVIVLGGVFVGMQIVPKQAIMDVNTIIASGPHAKVAVKQIQEAQEIYQYNLSVIEKKLASYENKAQARAYLIEAARQLQTQLNTSKLLVQQVLLNALNEVLEQQKQEYDFIVKKDGVIYLNKESFLSILAAAPKDITAEAQELYNKTNVIYPTMPKVVEYPNLPADLGADVAFPPKAKEAQEPKKENSKLNKK